MKMKKEWTYFPFILSPSKEILMMNLLMVLVNLQKQILKRRQKVEDLQSLIGERKTDKTQSNNEVTQNWRVKCLTDKLFLFKARPISGKIS